MSKEKKLDLHPSRGLGDVYKRQSVLKRDRGKRMHLQEEEQIYPRKIWKY